MTDGQRKYLEEVEKWSHVVISKDSAYKKRGTSQVLRVLDDTTEMKPSDLVALRDDANNRVFEKTLHWCRKNLVL